MKKTFVFTMISVAAVFMFGLQSCGKKSIDPAKLENKTWVLRTMDGVDSKSSFKGIIPTIEFNFKDSMASGNSGCNRYFGKFELNNDKFTMHNPAGTLMACFWENKESDYLRHLSSNNLTIVLEDNDNAISLRHDGKEVLRFTPETQEDIDYNNQIMNAPLSRRKSDMANIKADKESVQGEWVLAKITDTDLTEMYGERIPTMNFNADGGATGNAGCNNYRTTYTFEDNVITFSPVLSTRMACPNMEGETLFTQTLTNPLEIYINNADNALLFFNSDELVMEFTKK